MSQAILEPESVRATLEQLLEPYANALENYLAGGSEESLAQAYEFGRKAIEAGMGVVDVAVVHQHALAMILSHPLLPEECTKIAGAAERFFTECLAPYEMIIRGFREANDELSRLNQTLEQQVAERTHELEAACQNLEKTVDATVQAIASMVESR
ncbi:hypothetical protein FJY63_14045, partial [Candidatus Sumerlaeota bacterium]|nr:hypothetical protein [Candidatus Sumerlaeota bacterium]